MFNLNSKLNNNKQGVYRMQNNKALSPTQKSAIKLCVEFGMSVRNAIKVVKDPTYSARTAFQAVGSTVGDAYTLSTSAKPARRAALA